MMLKSVPQSNNTPHHDPQTTQNYSIGYRDCIMTLPLHIINLKGDVKIIFAENLHKGCLQCKIRVIQNSLESL